MSGECDNCGHHVVDCMCRTTPETDVIAREAVERIKNLVMARQDADGDLWVLACDYTDLLARVEKVEAERDAAYRAGQDEMRERAADEAVSSSHGGHYVACAIRALPLKDDRP